MKFKMLFERIGYLTYDDFDTSERITLINSVKEIKLVIDLKRKLLKKESFIESHSEFLTFDELLCVFLFMKEKGWF